MNTANLRDLLERAFSVAGPDDVLEDAFDAKETLCDTMHEWVPTLLDAVDALERLTEKSSKLTDVYLAVSAERDTLQARVASLEAGLRPFAAWGDYIDDGSFGELADDAVMYATIRARDGLQVKITAADLRTARALLGEGTQCNVEK